MSETSTIESSLPGSRTERELYEATRPFAVESSARSWWHVGSTFALVIAAVGGAAFAPWWPLQLLVSILAALLFVRAFILYHDFMHRALLRKSRLARWLFALFGLLSLTPPRYWRYSHNHHHANVGKPLEDEDGPELLTISDIGSFPLMTTDAWRTATRAQRLRYRVTRHPITILLAYVTVFFWSLCLLPFLQSPRKYWDGILSVGLHVALLAGFAWAFGLPAMVFGLWVPFWIAAAIGAYFFFAQHNFEGLHLLGPGEWTYYRGAVESSSHMRLGRVMHWFTGNIGYHTIHHLNPLVPFYRLPEAMAAVPELQHPTATSLRPRDILSCLRLQLWDPREGRLVTYDAVDEPGSEGPPPREPPASSSVG